MIIGNNLERTVIMGVTYFRVPSRCRFQNSLTMLTGIVSYGTFSMWVNSLVDVLTIDESCPFSRDDRLLSEIRSPFLPGAISPE